MRKLNAGFVYDDALRAAANRAGRNYWYLYVREIAAQLGFELLEIAPRDVVERVGECAVLFVGGGVEDSFSDQDAAAIRRWVEDGGVLIGFQAGRLADLFGVSVRGAIRQEPDDYTVSGYFRLVETGVAKDIHSGIRPERNLVILSDIQVLETQGATAIAYLQDSPTGDGTGPGSRPAVTERLLGAGAAYYFAFDVPKTIWVLHQGHPMWEDLDGDGWLRVQDMTVINEQSCEVMYADEIKFLIQKMMARHPVPFVHQIPPMGGAVADTFFHYGGDDEADSSGVQVTASDFMRSLGLPYQINAMPLNGKFHISDEHIARIKANGHVISLHYNFIDGYAQGDGVPEEDLRAQYELFVKTFGHGPVSTVNHWCRWYGWTEPARVMAELGQLGSHDWIHKGFPPANPKNVFSFAFGTALPFRFYEDYTRENRRIDFIELPHNAYEIGRTADESAVDWSTTKAAIDTAARYHVPLSMFFHPVYPARFENARQAMRNAVAYVAERKLRVKHMTSDDAVIWWKERGESRIEDARCEAGTLEFQVRAAHSDGIVVKIPARGRTPRSLAVDGRVSEWEGHTVVGLDWIYVVVPAGDHRVRVEWNAPDLASSPA